MYHIYATMYRPCLPATHTYKHAYMLASRTRTVYVDQLIVLSTNIILKSHPICSTSGRPRLDRKDP